MIDTALILAGGKGSRLAPWHAPKCLLPVNGIPILRRILAHVAPSVRRTIICTGYRASDIEAAVKYDRQNYSGGMNWLTFSHGSEDDPMCTRLLRAREEKKIEGRVLVCYGDELADVDITQLEDQHDRLHACMTFAVYRQTLPFGVVDTCGRIDDSAKETINIGFVLAEPSCWSSAEPSYGLSDWINKTRSDARLRKQGALLGNEPDLVHYYLHEGKRASINSLVDLKHAEEVWK